MIKKHLAVFGLMFALLAMFANPARANELTSATATADCTGYTLSVNAIDLAVGTLYTVSYTFTLTPTAPGGTVLGFTGTFTFTATSATQMGITAPLPPGATEIPWPFGTLNANYTVTASATLTALILPVPITINGSTSPTLSCAIQERMTGGGSVVVDLTATLQVTVTGTDPLTKVTHGFEIHCNPPNKNNTIEINWPGPNHFHLETLTLGTCVCNSHLLPPENPDAGFNEFIGAGTGKLNGTEGASIVFDFTDQGEPGTNDTESMTIFDSSGSPVLSFPTTNLTFGNQQAHRQGSGKVPPCNPPGS